MTLVGTIAAGDGSEDQNVEESREPTPDVMLDLATRFFRRFPNQDEASMRRGYTGIYDLTPDQQPVLGPAPSVPGLQLAAGFSGHGFKLAPVVGEMIAASALGQDYEFVADLELFGLSRFAEGRLIDAPHAYVAPMLG